MKGSSPGFRFWRPLALGLGALCLLLVGITVWQGRELDAYEELARRVAAVPVPAEPPPAPEAKLPRERLQLEAVSFSELPGWGDDAHGEALGPLLASCRRIGRRSDGAALDRLGVAGTVADWREACAAAGRLDPADHAAARDFFETRFQPLAVRDDGEGEGLFTGYYEPSLRGSRRRQAPFLTPLFRRPPELVSIDLGEFREELEGQRMAGRVVGGALKPFADRREIEGGALTGRGLELVWVEDPIKAFFLHIQGSGKVELADGGALRVGYDGQNGHPYFAIGRALVDAGELTREEVSLQTIRQWMVDHPDEARDLMHRNPSFIFFRELRQSGPVGAQGVVLTPDRSLAVDRSFHALGAPVWLDTSVPDVATARQDQSVASAPVGATALRPWRRLMIAQDTGGAIRGAVRGDLFLGTDEETAGRLKSPGRLWLLLPKPVVEASVPWAALDPAEASAGGGP